MQKLKFHRKNYVITAALILKLHFLPY